MKDLVVKIYFTACLGVTKNLVKLCNNSTAEVIESELNTNEKSTKYVENKCRRQLLAKCNRQPEALLPTQDSLKQHIRRAVYQAVFVWAQSLIPMQKPSKSR